MVTQWKNKIDPEMVKLSDVLKDRQFNSSACVAQIPSVPSSDSSCCETFEAKVLSYQDAWLAFQEHETWLKNLLGNVDIDGNRKSSTISSTNSSPTGMTHSGNIVLAYLVSNETDAMLSILAAANTPFHVALLNNRWTPSEMAHVLQFSSSISNADSGDHNNNMHRNDLKTFILYSATANAHAYPQRANFEDCAMGPLHDKANRTQVLLQHQHEAQVVQIPNFTNKYLRHTNQSAKSVHFFSSLDKNSANVTDESIDLQIRKLSTLPTTDAILLFTSGTTSRSKGVRLSHSALYIQALSKMRQPCQFNQTTCMLSTTVPIFHVGGFNSTLALWLAGGTWIIPQLYTVKTNKARKPDGFDPNMLLDMISHPIIATNTLVLVPAMIHSMLQVLYARSTATIYPNVDLVLIGGQSASESMLSALESFFPRARIVQTYACTEASSSMTFHKIKSQKETRSIPLVQHKHSGSLLTGDCIGSPPPHVQLHLVDPNQPRICLTEPYRLGVFVTIGPHVMTGYWKRHKNNNYSTINTNSFKMHFNDNYGLSLLRQFVTNDLGYQDEKGLFYFCGRNNDAIRTGGETVLAQEVERELLQLAWVEDCAVFGIKDERLGEMVCAAIVVSSDFVWNGRPTEFILQKIRAHCQGVLAGYKHPRRIFLVPSLPRNSSGKVVKYQLVQMYDKPRSKL